MQFGQTPPRDGMQFGRPDLYLFFWHAIRMHRTNKTKHSLQKIKIK